MKNTCHYETSSFVRAPPEIVFAYSDDQRNFSSHMSQSSWRLGGAQMKLEFDEDGGLAKGSKIRLSGRVLGIQLSVEEVVTEREPPRRKVWQTTGTPRLLVIGHYAMGFDITPAEGGSRLRVFIDYGLPEKGPAHWIGWLFGRYYARWCTRKMANDVAAHFGVPQFAR